MSEPAENRWGERLRLIATLGSVAILLTLVFMALQTEPGQPEQAVDRLGPLPGYPACESPTPDAAARAPEGLIVPRSAVVTKVTRRGEMWKASGYVPLTPVQLRRHYRDAPGVEVLQIEDEIIEAEALLTDGRFRSYVKATAVCELGSRFVAIVAAERQSGLVPTPAGGA